MRTTLAFATLCLAGLGLPAVAHAQTTTPYITVTNCEPVVLGGQTVNRLTLRVLAKTGYVEGVRVEIPFHANPADTCTVLEAAAPAGWFVSRQEDGRVFFGTMIGEGIHTNNSLDGFQITLNHPNCCLLFVLTNPLLLDDSGSTQVCFEGCLATPAALASWGQVKSIYR